MRLVVAGAVLVGVMAVGGYALFFCHSGGSAHSGDATEAQATAAQEGKAKAEFDPVMSGVCRFSCATKLTFDAGDVEPQPGATNGALTQCPVSGVVFAVDDERPHVQVAAADYVLCCDQCAEKFRKDPGRFVSL